MKNTVIKMAGSPQNRKAYIFLKSVEAKEVPFQLSELLSATKWKKDTAKQYLSTRLKQFVTLDEDGYRVTGCTSISQDDFCRLVSQSVSISRDPLKPELSAECEERIIKAREAALAAVQHYNNPTATFRSGTYLILMIVAFTALFHAVFERDSIPYFRVDSAGNRHKVGKDYALWDALEAAHYYATNYVQNYASRLVPHFLTAMESNLKFLLPIRHIFEHRHMPPLDATLAAHCQALLFNFETILSNEFTTFYAINTSLTIALQLSTERNANTLSSLRRLHSDNYKELSKYINDFHTNLTDEIIANPAFAFRVWLVPKTAKEARKSDMSIEYVKLDPNNPNQMEALENAIIAIKQSIRSVSNTNLLKPNEVSEKITIATGRKFTAATHHSRAWKHFKIRPERNSAEPDKTITDFCIYDQAHKDYLYTPAWVNYLIKKLENSDVCDIIYRKPLK